MLYSLGPHQGNVVSKLVIGICRRWLKAFCPTRRLSRLRNTEAYILTTSLPTLTLRPTFKQFPMGTVSRALSGHLDEL